MLYELLNQKLLRMEERAIIFLHIACWHNNSFHAFAIFRCQLKQTSTYAKRMRHIANFVVLISLQSMIETYKTNSPIIARHGR